MIAVVVPTVRPDCLRVFLEGWRVLFAKHQAKVVVVQDGAPPTVFGLTPRDLLGKDADLIYNYSDCCRNLGFAFVAKHYPEAKTILTLDDDTLPLDDPIQAHLDALDRRFPLSWISTASDYVRGIPYGVRSEAECVVSHGVWQGVMDWDAPTQLVKGNRQLSFYQGAIPRGVYFPFCGMNVAFKRKMLPYLYYAPMGHRVGFDRFADIWLGINLKRVCDENDWAIATGYSTVRHERASNVFKNLQKEAKGLELNETYYRGVEDDPYFSIYRDCRKRWQEWIYEHDRTLSPLS